MENRDLILPTMTHKEICQVELAAQVSRQKWCGVTRVAVPQAQGAVHFRAAAGTAASGQKVLERGRLIVKVMLIFPK